MRADERMALAAQLGELAQEVLNVQHRVLRWRITTRQDGEALEQDMAKVRALADELRLRRLDGSSE